MLFYILLQHENDLREVETSDFYYQIFIKEISY